MAQKRLMVLGLVVTFMLVSAGCTLVEPEKIPEPVPANVQVYGRIEEALADYRLTPYYTEADYPQVFQENGQYGFRDQAGNVLVPAEYDGAKDFYRGYGSVYQDAAEADGERQWFYVGPTGRVVQYDYIQGFYAEDAPCVSVAKRGERFGLLNSELAEIIPLQYERLTAARDYDTGQWVSYGQKDGQWVQFDLAAGVAYHYEPCAEGGQQAYAATVDMNQYQLSVVNDYVVVNGRTDFLGADFPFALLDGLWFDLYEDGAYRETCKAELAEGLYEGELMVRFKSQPYDWTRNYFAVPTGSPAYPLEITEDTAYDKYYPAVEDFLQSNGIERSPYVISKALQGDFTGSGQTGAIIAVADSDWKSDGETFRTWAASASTDIGAMLMQEKMGVYAAVLYFPDASDLTQYEVLQSDVFQEERMREWIYYDLLAAAQLYGDERYEAIIVCRGYEFVDVIIREL